MMRKFEKKKFKYIYHAFHRQHDVMDYDYVMASVQVYVYQVGAYFVVVVVDVGRLTSLAVCYADIVMYVIR